MAFPFYDPAYAQHPPRADRPPVGLRPQLKALGLAGLSALTPPTAPGLVVFTRSRSGSTLLVSLLDQVPGVTCGREILLRPLRWPTAWVVGRRRRAAPDVYGFKVMLNHLFQFQGIEQPGAWLANLRARGWSIVYLERTNLVRQSVSLLLAEAEDAWHVQAGRPAPSGRVRIDPETLLVALRRGEGLRRLEALVLEGMPHLHLVYERDLLPSTAHQATVDAVAAHVGFASHPVAPRLERLSSGDLSERVENYDEVRSALSGTPWGAMLTDP